MTPFFFFFNDTATTEIYTLSLHDALPISPVQAECVRTRQLRVLGRVLTRRPLARERGRGRHRVHVRSEEHTSELQSRSDLVCRLLLEKKKIPGPTLEVHCTDPPIVTSTAA